MRGHATGVGAALDADDQQGVDCEACHRSIDASAVQPAVTYDGATIAALAVLDPQAPYIGNARLHWDPRDVRHGPYDNADSPAHAAAGSPYTSSSELCGQCHEVLSPLRNLLGAAGTDTGFPFPLDNTYTEWLSSDYARGATAKSCIACHMPAARGDALKVSTFPSAMSRANPRTHVFVGGNAWGLEAVKLAAPQIATDRSGAFDVAAAAVQAMLDSAVQIDITPGQAPEGGTTVDLVVRVTNLSGHKFPTGYADGRRAFLQVELTDARGGSLGLLGRYDDAAAHLDTPSELRVWESIQAEHLSGGGHREWHIAKNDTVVKDTRIPARRVRPDRRRGDRDDRAGRRRLRSRHRDAELRRRPGAVLVAGAAAARIAAGHGAGLLPVDDARIRRGAGARQHDRRSRHEADGDLGADRAGGAAPDRHQQRRCHRRPAGARKRRRNRCRQRRRPRRRRDARPPRTNRSVAAARSRRPSTDGQACSGCWRWRRSAEPGRAAAKIDPPLPLAQRGERAGARVKPALDHVLSGRSEDDSP